MSQSHYLPAWNKYRKVIIAQADPHQREQLSMLFRFEGYQVLPVGSLSVLRDVLAHERPDLMVVHAHLGDDDTIEYLAEIRGRHRGITTIVTLDAESVETTVRAMQSGAYQVFAYPIKSEVLLDAARDRMRKAVVVTQTAESTQVTLRGFNQLTPREMEVMELLIEGYSNKEIGKRLNISPRTVEVHRARCLSKLGARNTADMIRIALSQ